MAEIGRAMARGAVWMIALRLVDKSIGFVSTIILARLLVPEDFGVVAMAMALYGLVQLLGAFNFDVALIQGTSASRERYDTAWTLNIFFGAVCCILLLLLAYPASSFYEEPRIAPIVLAMSVAPLIEGFCNIGMIAFRRELKFNLEFRYSLIGRVLGFALTISVALIVKSYWALVVGSIGRAVASLIISYWAHPFRPRFCLVAKAELIRFSGWLLVNNFIFFFRGRLQDVFVGRLLGPSALGIMTIANEIATLPTSELAAPVNRAVFPGYARLAEQAGALRRGFLQVISGVFLVVLPASAGIICAAPLIVEVVLGEKWMAAVPLIQIFAVHGAAMALQTNTGLTLIALGKPKLLSWLAGLHLALLVPAILVGSHAAEIQGVATGIATVSVLLLPVNYWVVMRRIDVSMTDLVSYVWRPVVSVSAMTPIVLAVRHTLADGGVSPGFTLVLVVIVGVLSYCVASAGLLLISRSTDALDFAIAKILRSRAEQMIQAARGLR